MENDAITGEVANAIVRRLMDDYGLSEKQAERVFLSKFQQPDARAPVIKRYRSASHRPDAACIASSRAEAREFFRKLMGVEKLPANFKLVRY